MSRHEEGGRILASRVLDSPRSHGVWPPIIDEKVNNPSLFNSPGRSLFDSLARGPYRTRWFSPE